MCGIAGVHSRSSSSHSSAELETIVHAMLSRIQHRGRDEESVLPTVLGCLGCCRLPVVDRDRGQQPMKNEDGTVRAVFNGEIYNRKELRSTLAHHTVASDCDSDLIVHLYEHTGKDL